MKPSRMLLSSLASVKKAKRRTTRRLRLQVEQLERREVFATFAWLPTAPGAYNWNDSANWSGGAPGTFPNATDDVANVTSATTGNQLINLNGPVTIGGLNLGSTGSGGAFTIAANGATGSLTLDVASGSATITETNKGGDAILAPIALNDNATFTGGGTAPASLGADITGAKTLTATGTINLFSGVTIGSTTSVAGTATFATPSILYSTSFYDSALYGYNGDTGAVLATLVAPNTTTLLSLPAGLTTGPDGNLYLSSQNNNAILRYNLKTDALETFISSAVLQPIATSQGLTNFAPSGLRFGPDGNLYVSLNGGFSAFNGAIVRFDVTTPGGVPTYAGTNTIIATTGLAQPSGLAFGTASGDTGNLYVANAIFGNVVKITGATGATPSSSTFVANNSGGLEFPSSLTFGPDGDLYVTDLGAFDGKGQIFRYNSDGSFDSIFVAAGSGAGAGDLFGQFPSDLLFDSAGKLLVDNLGPNGPSTGSNQYAGSVYQYSSSGVFDTALVTAAQFPDSSGPNDSTATGVIPSQIALVSPISLQTLTVTLPTQTTENLGVNALQGTVTRTGSTAASLVVKLRSNDTTELQVPATVTIPAGQTSATFSITVPNDDLDDGTQHVTVTATVGGYIGGSAKIDVLDDDAPVLSPLSPASYTENAAPLTLAGSATISDNNSADFNTGVLTVSVVANVSSSDRLAIQNQGTGAGQVGIAGSIVTFGGVAIGTFSGGVGSTPLAIAFTSSAATPTAARAVLRAVQFSNVSDAPSTAARTIRFKLTDGDGGASNSVNQTLTVVAVNDAPTLDTTSPPTLAAINEDNVSSAGTSVATLIAGITDPDAGALKGIAVTSVNTAHGTWEYTLNNGATWTSIGSPTGATALLLPADGNNARVRFLPAADFNGTSASTIRYAAWDRTTGAAGDTVDISFAGSRGGSAAFSTATRLSTIDVNPVNDAPVPGGITGTIGYTRGGSTVTIAPTATVKDIDSPDFDTGVLFVQITSGKDGKEQLTLGGGFTLAGNDVVFGSTTIGVRSGTGNNGNNLLITFNSNATAATVQALLRGLQFSTTAGAGAGARSLGISVTDGDGGGTGLQTRIVNVN